MPSTAVFNLVLCQHAGMVFLKIQHGEITCMFRIISSLVNTEREIMFLLMFLKIIHNILAAQGYNLMESHDNQVQMATGASKQKLLAMRRSWLYIRSSECPLKTYNFPFCVVHLNISGLFPQPLKKPENVFAVVEYGNLKLSAFL